MEQSLTIAPNQLNTNLLEALRKYISGINATEVTISFKSPDTPSLRKESAEETRNRIEASIKYFEEGNKGVEFTMDEFKELSEALLKMK